ncbi:hypothetical protein JY651_17145 [Pyxidicoccus parkwayensis]|uniref:Lipoprotein n=1 Tax=Pyxidicoccus parkwayensis TaxID=2813578 RepID=A0ABX7P7Y1_9BACT|nr:hypothetical protein [Pyxidicoccus parkwaysis]QSQ26549.1 hypothetical protein JY651_17145 [Pyxidicoccus parkwaysis]
MKRSSTWMMVCGLTLVMGCGGPPEDVQADAPEAPRDGLLSQTILREQPDGTMTQETTFITREEQLAQIEARDAIFRSLGGRVTQQDLDDLLTDSGCAGSSLWLFDQTSLTGNQLCLYKQVGADQGWLNLGTIFRKFQSPIFLTWANAVRSLYSGVHPGALQSCTATSCSATIYQNFNAYQRLDSIFYGTQLNWAYLYTP